MNKKLPTLLLFSVLLCASVFLVGCVSTDVWVEPSAEMNDGDFFYIARYNDNLGVSKYILETFLECGLNAEVVYNAASIPEKETPELSGTGFYIAQDIIVTNEHVLNGEDEITYYQNGVKHSAIPVFTSEQNDIAILKCDSIDEPYFKLLTSKDYSLAAPIFVLGYPLTGVLGNEIRITSGIINAMTGISGDTNFVQVSAPIQPGNSGGPVVNENYEVIGIASSKLSDAYTIATNNTIAQNVNFAIKSDLVSFIASQYLPSGDDANYVDSLDEAINATVKIEAGGTELIPAKQYYIDFSYLGRGMRLLLLNMTCTDVETGKVIAEANWQSTDGSSYSVDFVASDLTSKVIAELYGLSKGLVAEADSQI